MLSRLETHYTYAVIALALAIVVLWLRGRHLINTVYTSDFLKFRKSFLIVYTFILMAVWLESHSAFHSEAGELIVARTEEHHVNRSYGLLTAAVLGSVVGAFIDRCGRRFVLFLSCMLFAAACVLRHVDNEYAELASAGMVGLFHPLILVALETWLIHEHKRLGYPDEWLASTFSSTVLLTGVAAVLTAPILWLLPRALGEETRALFGVNDIAAALLVVAAVWLFVRWRENYGDDRNRGCGNVFTSLRIAVSVIASNDKIMFLGVIQSAFGAVTRVLGYTWSSALSEMAASGEEVPFELAAFVNIMGLLAGTLLFLILKHKYPVESFSRAVLVISTVSLALEAAIVHWGILESQTVLRFLPLTVHALCLGIYLPSFSMQCSSYIPSEVRGTVISMFVVGESLLFLGYLQLDLSWPVTFLACALFLASASLGQYFLFAKSQVNATASKASHEAMETSINVEE